MDEIKNFFIKMKEIKISKALLEATGVGNTELAKKLECELMREVSMVEAEMKMRISNLLIAYQLGIKICKE